MQALGCCWVAVTVVQSLGCCWDAGTGMLLGCSHCDAGTGMLLGCSHHDLCRDLLPEQTDTSHRRGAKELKNTSKAFAGE